MEKAFIDLQTYEEKLVPVDKLYVIIFWAAWHPECHAQEQKLVDIAAFYKDRVDVFCVNVDKMADVAASFKVKAVPTALFLRNGKVINKLKSFFSQEVFSDMISRNL